MLVNEFDGPTAVVCIVFSILTSLPTPTYIFLSPYGRLSKGHREFSDYCLESTAQALATKFPGHAVWVVLPKTLVHGALASYDNFGKTDWESGGAVLECECDQNILGRLQMFLRFLVSPWKVCLALVFHA